MVSSLKNCNNVKCDFFSDNLKFISMIWYYLLGLGNFIYLMASQKEDIYIISINQIVLNQFNIWGSLYNSPSISNPLTETSH